MSTPEGAQPPTGKFAHCPEGEGLGETLASWTDTRVGAEKKAGAGSPPRSALMARKTALLALELGLSPVPPRENGSKAPIADLKDDKGGWTWKPYQTTPATREHVESWYRSGLTGAGLVGGYGDLDPFEFDHPETFKHFLEAA
jgi:hypothetical protein